MNEGQPHNDITTDCREKEKKKLIIIIKSSHLIGNNNSGVHTKL